MSWNLGLTQRIAHPRGAKSHLCRFPNGRRADNLENELFLFVTNKESGRIFLWPEELVILQLM